MAQPFRNWFQMSGTIMDFENSLHSLQLIPFSVGLVHRVMSSLTLPPVYLAFEILQPEPYAAFLVHALPQVSNYPSACVD